MEIKETGKGADWFGPCEVCGKRCDNHHMQRVTGSEKAKFGHLDCVRSGVYADAKIIKQSACTQGAKCS